MTMTMLLVALLCQLPQLARANEPLTLLADNKTVVPGSSPSVTFDFFSAPFTSGSLIGFVGSGGDTNAGRGPGGAFVIDSAAATPELAAIYSSSDPAPGGGTLNQTGDLSLCEDGTAFFFSAPDQTPKLLVSHPPASSGAKRTVEVVVGAGAAAPGGDGDKFAGFGNVVSASGTAATGLHMVFLGLVEAAAGGDLVKGLYIASTGPAAGRTGQALNEGEWSVVKILDNSTAMPTPDGQTSFKDFGDNAVPVSPDGKHAVFFASDGARANDPEGRHGVFEWSASDGLSCVVNDNQTGSVPGKDDSWHWSAFGGVSMAANKQGDTVACFMAEAFDGGHDAPLVGIWCRHQGALTFVAGSSSVIPDSPEPSSPHNLFQYLDYPAVSIEEDGLSYMLVFQGNDGLGRRGVYRALGPEQLTTVTDWQDPIDKQAIFNIQLKMPAYTGSSVAVWIDTKGSRGEGIYATAAGTSKR